MEQERNSIPAENYSTGLDVKGRLEQLQTLKDAGLITKQEYEQKRQEILKEL
ncbi:MAG: SHOCT domain-containing protein [Oscillibacter sp.]|nr:SHOCT domain-containing protein [Oscillibacter sp.]